MVIQLTADFQGTNPEHAIYRALEQLGYKEGEDFIFQSSQLGGRMSRGGLVLDFFLPGLNLGINVQGIYWHYQRSGQLAIDRIQRAALESYGITIVYIDEDDALKNARYYVEEALRGVDHSAMTRGF